MPIPNTPSLGAVSFDVERDRVGAASTDERVVAVLDALRDDVAEAVAQALTELRALDVDEPDELVDLQLIEVELHRTKGDDTSDQRTVPRRRGALEAGRGSDAR